MSIITIINIVLKDIKRRKNGKGIRELTSPIIDDAVNPNPIIPIPTTGTGQGRPTSTPTPYRTRPADVKIAVARSKDRRCSGSRMPLLRRAMSTTNQSLRLPA